MFQPSHQPNPSRGLIRRFIPSYRSPAAAPPPPPSTPPTPVAVAPSEQSDAQGDPSTSRAALPARPQSTHSRTSSQSTRGQSRLDQTHATNDPPRGLSRWSSPAVPDSVWFATNFLVGAGMVILQPSTAKVVLLHDLRSDYWSFRRAGSGREPGAGGPEGGVRRGVVWRCAASAKVQILCEAL